MAGVVAGVVVAAEVEDGLGGGVAGSVVVEAVAAAEPVEREGGQVEIGARVERSALQMALAGPGAEHQHLRPVDHLHLDQPGPDRP